MNKIGRVTSASVHKGTGRDWDEWLGILNRVGARAWTHQEIVAFLKKKYKLSAWWQQGVTLGYELATGRRQEGQSLKGDYSLTATKSMPLTVKKLWQLVVSREGTQAWLKPLSPFSLRVGAEYECEGGIFGKVRTLKAPERIRLSWQDTEWPKSTVLSVMLVPRPAGKSIFVLQHNGLASPALRETMRSHWKAAIADLAAVI